MVRGLLGVHEMVAGGLQKGFRIAYNCYTKYTMKQQITSFSLVDFINQYNFLATRSLFRCGNKK